jgi:penicillin-binding protein 1A
MTSILQDVIKRGTGKNAKVKGIELAGKTGTTNDGVDAWFCGYSPTITTISWFGRDNNRRIGRGATGGSVAAPSFSYFYKEILKLYPNIERKFIRPVGVKDGVLQNGKREFYTDISPLQNKKIERVNPFDVLDSNSAGSDLDENVEVININDDPVQDRTDRDNEPINPIDLKRVEPQRVGDDSGTMF